MALQDNTQIITHKIYGVLFSHSIKKFATLDYIGKDKITEIYNWLSNQISDVIKKISRDQKSNNTEFHEIVNNFIETISDKFGSYTDWNINRCDIMIDCLHSEISILERLQIDLQYVYPALVRNSRDNNKNEIFALQQIFKMSVEENKRLAKFHL